MAFNLSNTNYRIVQFAHTPKFISESAGVLLASPRHWRSYKTDFDLVVQLTGPEVKRFSLIFGNFRGFFGKSRTLSSAA